MQRLAADLRLSVRQMIRGPGFTLTALISLARGISATSGVFSIVYAALINPFPYPHADRIVRLTMKSKADDLQYITLNGRQVQELRKSPVVESVLAMDYRARALSGPDYPENLRQ